MQYIRIVACLFIYHCYRSLRSHSDQSRQYRRGDTSAATSTGARGDPERTGAKSDEKAEQRENETCDEEQICEDGTR